MVGAPQGDEKEYACAADVDSTSASMARAGVASAMIASATPATRAAMRISKKPRKEPNARLLRSGCLHIRSSLPAKLLDQTIVVGVGHGGEGQNDLLDLGRVEKRARSLALHYDLRACDAEARALATVPL